MESMNDEATWFRFAEKLQAFAGELWNGIDIPLTPARSADPKLVACLLFLRMMSNFRAAILLAENGMIAETRTIVRCCVENLIWLGGIHKDNHGFIEKMCKDEVKSRDRRIKMIVGSNLYSDLAAKTGLEEVAASLNETWPKSKLLNAHETAKDGPISEVNLLYSQLSADAAHPSLSALARHIALENESEIPGVAIQARHEEHEFMLTLNFACMALLGACVAYREIAESPFFESEMRAINAEFAALEVLTKPESTAAKHHNTR